MTYRCCSQSGLLEFKELVENDELHLLAAPGPELGSVLGEPGLQVLLELVAPCRKLRVLALQLNGKRDWIVSGFPAAKRAAPPSLLLCFGYFCKLWSFQKGKLNITNRSLAFSSRRTKFQMTPQMQVL